MAKKNVGSNFDEFLEEEGILEEASVVAVKRVIAFQRAVQALGGRLNVELKFDGKARVS